MGEHEMPPAGMTLRQLELLCAVADHGSFAAAGQAKFLTPNAVSLAVTELETHLGVKLCVRQRARGVTLTKAGHTVVERARRLLKEAYELHDSVSSPTAEIEGQVAVGCYSTLAPTVVPALLEEFTEQHPGVDLTCVDGRTLDLVSRLRSGELDLMVAYEVALPTGLEKQTLFTALPAVLLAADHRLARREQVPLRELAGEPLILLDVPPSGENTLKVLQTAGLRPKIAHRSGSFELVRSLVGRGLGYSLAYQRPWTHQSYEGRGVVALPITPETGGREVVVCWARSTPLTGPGRAVVEFLRSRTPG